MSRPESSASLADSVARVGSGTLISRLLGFARDLVIARLFGASQATDAFFVAFRIPNLMRRLFAEGAFAATLIPALTRTGGMDPANQDSTRKLVSEFAGSLTVLLVLMTSLGLLTAPLLVWLLAPGFSADNQQAQLTTSLLRLILPYLLFIGLTALAGAVLNAYDRFAVPAITPALLNLSMIGCALLLAPQLKQPVFALAWGVVLGGVAQLTLQLVALGRLGLLAFPSIHFKTPAWRDFLRALGPTLVGMSVTQINLLFDTLLASFLIVGSISWLYYAERLMDFPLGILGAALSTAILPRLARTHAAGNSRDFSTTLDWALRWVALLGLPAAAGLLILAEPMIATLFYSERFGSLDTRQASGALMAYALGLPFFMAFKVMAPGFFSRADLKTPLRIALISIAINTLLSILLMSLWGHIGLALATSIAAACGAGLLLRAMLMTEGTRLKPGWPRLVARILLSTLAMALLLWLLLPILFSQSPWIPAGDVPANWADCAPGCASTRDSQSLLMRGLRLAELIIAGLLCYSVSFFALGGRWRHLLP